jgi:hypothetical protein
MPSLRYAHRIGRFVLVWFALSIGVAIASPLVKPQNLQLICSGSGALKVIAGSEDGKTSSTSKLTLDCPLCAGLGAPPPWEAVGFTTTAPLRYTLPRLNAGRFTPTLATPPPARGPPPTV